MRWNRRKDDQTPQQPAPPPPPPPGPVSISNVSRSAVAVGSNNYLVQGSDVSNPPADTAALDQAITALRESVYAQAGPLKEPALEHVAAMNKAVQADPPDIKTLIRVRDWFKDNLPTIAPAVLGILAHPTLDAAMAAAAQVARGTAAASGHTDAPGPDPA